MWPNCMNSSLISDTFLQMPGCVKSISFGDAQKLCGVPFLGATKKNSFTDLCHLDVFCAQIDMNSSLICDTFANCPDA